MRSMTAFGRATVQGEGYELTVELRSVNNRYLDVNFRLPRAWAAQEERIKATLSAMGVSRGKVDFSVSLTDTRAQSGAALLEPDLEAARRYVEAALLLRDELNVDHDLTTSRLLTLPGVMVPVKEDTAEDDDAVWAKLAPAVTEAVTAFLAAREREGARLATDVLVPGFPAFCLGSRTVFRYNRRYVLQRSSCFDRGFRNWGIPKRACCHRF